MKTKIGYRRWTGVLAGILLSLAPDLLCALPQKVLYQGTLRRSGTIFTGNGTFLFRVTDATGASEYWTSGSTVVAVTSGLFRYPLGVDNLGGTGLNSKPFANIPWALIEPYVEVTVDGILLSPREPLSSVPYALYFTTGDAFSVGGSTFAVAYGKVGIGTTNPSTSLDIQGGHMTIGPTGPNAYNIRFSTRGLIMFNNAFANLGTGANVGGLGFINAGNSHGQFHYRARKGFEFLDVSADAPTIDHLSSAFAPLHAGALVIGGLDESRYNLYTGPADGATIAGNVGIGTTLPQGRLEVRPSAAENYSLFVSSQDASPILTVDKAGDVFIGAPATHDLTSSQDLHVAGNVIVDGQFIGHTASGSSITFTSGGDFIVGTSTLVVTSGRVGIGTTNPAAPLEVLSSGIESARITRTSGNTYLRIGRPGIAADDNAILAWDDTAKQLQMFVSGEGNGSVLNIANGGNVGVGTTNPNTKLQTGSHTRGEGALGYMQAQGVIESQGTSPGSYANLAGYNGILLRHNSWGTVATDPGKRFILYLENSNGDLRFAHDGFGTAMTITQTANVGIGTTIPAATLDVNGSAQFGSGVNKSTFTSSGDLQLAINKEVRFPNGRLIDIGPSAAEGVWLENFTASKRLYLRAPGSVVLGEGNVGITGGSLTAMNPAALLHVTSGTVLIDGNAATSFKIGASTLTVTGDGNVGIGATSPQSKLTVNTSATNPGSMLEINNRGDQAAGAWSAIRFGLDSASYPNQYAKGGVIYESRDGFNRGKLHLAINNAASVANVGLADAILTVDSGGNVGIGTTNPAAALDVAGTGAFKMPTGTTAQRPASPVAGMMRFNSGNASVEFYNGISWMTAVALSTPPAASGGTETTIVEDGIPYKIHTFTANGSLTVTSPGFVEVLVVAGGGSGGNHNTTNGNGGGGGGGVVYRKSYPVTTAGSPYAVTVGAGGAAIGFQVVSRGNNGGDSVFATLTAKGGGGGGSTGVGAHAFNGGSGGGGGAVNGAYGGGASNQTGGYGNQGGRSYVGWTGGGGGGAGSVGNAVTIAPNSPPDGNGGRGMGFTISGSLVYYAGGGGGGGNSSERAGDGYDGGGRGFGTTAANDYNNYPVGTNATTGGSTTLHALANTGGGGGGGSYWSNNSTGWAGSQGSGSGGSGIVIVRYRLLQ